MVHRIEIIEFYLGPGVSVIDNVLYVIGGFYFIGRDIVWNG